MNTKIVKLDINRNLYDTLTAKQGDTQSRFLLFQLLDGAIPFSLENRSVKVFATKPDGKEVFNDLIINDRVKGYCTLELTNQMLAVPGLLKLELMVIEGDKKLTTNVFYMDVKKSINSENAIVSTNEFSALLNGLASLNEYDNYKNEIAAARDGEVNLLTKVKKIDEHLDNKTSELKTEKVDRNEFNSRVWSMANMGQDIKEAMTGGSVAVVGKHGILSENVAPKQITASKLNDNSSRAFIYEKSPLAYGCEKFLNVEYEIGALNGSGQEAINNTKIRSDFFTISGFCKINIEENYTLTLFKYDRNKSFLSLTGVSNGHILDTSIPYYRAVIAKNDGSSPIDIQPFIDSVVYCIGEGNKIVEIDNSIKQSKFKEQAYSLGYENILDLKWEIGALNASGQEAINNYKIRSNFFNTITPTLIKFLQFNNIYISLFKYDSDKNFISFTNSADVDVTLNDDKLYRIVISNLAGELVTDIDKYTNMLLLVQGKNSIAPYKFKKGIIMGDSITARHDDRGWVQHFKKITEPINIINIAVPSATWCDKEGTIYDGDPVSAGEDNNRNNVMGNQVQKIINNKYEEPDYIIMACGTNDNIVDTITDEEIEKTFFQLGEKVPLENVDRKTFQGAIRYCVEKLREIYPNTDIFICTPIQRTHSDENLGNYTAIRKKSDNIRRIAERVGVQLIDSMKCGVYDMSGEPGQDLGDFYDGLHLNTTGAYKLGRYNAINFINWYNY